MEVISSKNIINIIRKTLNLIDKRLINHGERVGYILYKMLTCENIYTKEELLSFTVTGLLHDIGAYKNEELDNMVQFETKDVWGHSIYGYLFLKYLSPIADNAEIVLYHHEDYINLTKMGNNRYITIAGYLNLADRIDVCCMNSEEVDIQDFAKKYGNVKFSIKSLELFEKADKDFHIREHIKDFTYKEELNRILGEINLGQEIIEKFLNMLIFSIDFRSEYTVVHAITTASIADEIGRLMGLLKYERDILHYGALLHDIGKISTPMEILEAPGRLSEKEMNIMRNHVNMSEYILKDYINLDILEIAIRHHERLDGSGYPKRLIESQLTLPQRILAVADVISALCGKRSYKEAYEKEKVITVLLREKEAGRLCGDTIDCAIKYFDVIMEHVLQNTVGPLQIYGDIKARYQEYYLNLVKLSS